MICPNCGGTVVQVGESPAQCQSCDWFNASDPRWLARVEELKGALKPRQTHQERVDEWLSKVFTPEELRDATERSLRCAEEGIELAQACGVDAATLHRLVDYVMGRPKGEASQEIAGVLVTAYAVAYALNTDADYFFDKEMQRISTPEIMEKIRRRQPEKRAALTRDEKLAELDRLVAAGGEPAHSFLAVASATGPRCKPWVTWEDAGDKVFGSGTRLESTTNGERWVAGEGPHGSLTVSRTWNGGGVSVSHANPKMYRVVPAEPAPCAWFEPAPLLDPESGHESCTSGKPATFKNCGFDGPACEDHKCRCVQPAQPAPDPDPYAEVEHSAGCIEINQREMRFYFQCECDAETENIRRRAAKARAEQIAAGDVPIDMSPEGVEGLNVLLRSKS